MIISAPAKVNLSLRILRKREDGFHELETLMAPLPGLADELVIEEAEEFSFSCDAPGVPTDESNLVVRAVQLFEERTKKSCHFEITLRKLIPHGAGLGGGSSNAASCLLALNELTASGLSLDDLCEMAAQLGSDVPFFLYGKACLCRGRGEQVEPVGSDWSRELVLLKPAFGISTPDAYKRWQNSQELPGVSYAEQKVDALELVNDLERPVFEKHLFLAETKRWMLAREEVEAALMSGSGSTMFAVLKEGRNGGSLIKAAREELDPKLWAWAGSVEA